MPLIIILILIILFIIIDSIYQMFLKTSFSNEKLIHYSELLDDLPCSVIAECKLILSTTSTASFYGTIKDYNSINNKEDYKIVIQALIDALYDADRKRNVLLVNLLAHYMVKYYTKYIVRYGNFSEKSVLRNMTALLKKNGILKDDYKEESTNKQKAYYICANCGIEVDKELDYCPNCEAKFIDEDIEEYDEDIEE